MIAKDSHFSTLHQKKETSTLIFKGMEAIPLYKDYDNLVKRLLLDKKTIIDDFSECFYG